MQRDLARHLVARGNLRVVLGRGIDLQVAHQFADHVPLLQRQVDGPRAGRDAGIGRLLCVARVDAEHCGAQQRRRARKSEPSGDALHGAGSRRAWCTPGVNRQAREKVPSRRDPKCNNAGLKAGVVRNSVMGLARRLLTILLDARGAQAGKSMLVDGVLPGQEFFDGQRVAAAGFLQARGDRRVRQRQLRPCAGSPSAWYRARADRRSSAGCHPAR